jgi:integrase
VAFIVLEQLDYRVSVPFRGRLFRRRPGCGAFCRPIRSLFRQSQFPEPRYVLADVYGGPSELSPDQISIVLKSVRKDRSPMGLRDYAILQLLATYGLRSGEISRLRLDDRCAEPFPEAIRSVGAF